MPIVAVDDAGDRRLDEYRNVPDPVLLEQHGVFVAEGRLVVRRLLSGSRFVARALMVTQVTSSGPTRFETEGRTEEPARDARAS